MAIQTALRLYATVLGTLAFAAPAMARPDTRTLTCEQTHSLIEREGAVVLTTGPHTYDRFVSRRGYNCSWYQAPSATRVPTRDGQCRVFRCRDIEYDFPRDFRR